MPDDKVIKLYKLDKEKTTNFWNSCPLNLNYLPKKSCKMAIPEFGKDGRVIKEPKCAWWINSEKHNYCFWKFVQDRSDEDGNMQELVQADLAKLFGWSNTKAHFMLKEAMEELIATFKKHGFQDELKELSDHYSISQPTKDDLDPKN